MASDPGWWRVAVDDDVDARERVEGVAVRVEVLLLAVAGMVVVGMVVALVVVVVAVAVMVVVVVGECAAKAGCAGASAGS